MLIELYELLFHNINSSIHNVLFVFAFNFHYFYKKVYKNY